MSGRRGASTGFTLIELMVAMAIIGVIAAVAIPSLLNGLDRGKQKRTMADLRTIALAVEAYSLDNNFFPNASDTLGLATAVEPVYTKSLPLRDGWGNTYRYETTLISYTIGSCGKGGGTALTLNGGGGRTGKFTDDIVYVDGNFVQWPEGKQE